MKRNTFFTATPGVDAYSVSRDSKDVIAWSDFVSKMREQAWSWGELGDRACDHRR